MAQALLNHLCPQRFVADSAGLEPGVLNPLAVQAMADMNIDISQNPTQSVFDLFKSGKIYQYVIAVCDKEAAEKCPIFPMIKEQLHWSFPDPSAFEGSDVAKLARTIEIRDQIKTKLLEWCAPYCD